MGCRTIWNLIFYWRLWVTEEIWRICRWHHIRHSLSFIEIDDFLNHLLLAEDCNYYSIPRKWVFFDEVFRTNWSVFYLFFPRSKIYWGGYHLLLLKYLSTASEFRYRLPRAKELAAFSRISFISIPVCLRNTREIYVFAHLLTRLSLSL